MSVGHVQRAIEEAGTPTVSVYVKPFGHLPELMGLSRTLVTPHPMGRPLGPPGHVARQRSVVEQALSLLNSSEPVVEEMPGRYSPGRPGSGNATPL